jgi:hypothetical protein
MDPVEQAMFAHIVAMKKLYDITNSDDTYDETHVTLAICEYNQTNAVLDQTLVDLIENDKELWAIIKSKGSHRGARAHYSAKKQNIIRSRRKDCCRIQQNNIPQLADQLICPSGRIAHKNQEYFHTFSKWLRDHRMEVMCDNLEFLTDFAITSKKYRDDIRNARDNLIRQLEN